MMRTDGGATPAPGDTSTSSQVTAAGPALKMTTIGASTSLEHTGGDNTRFQQAMRLPWTTVLAYAAGGVAYATVLAAAQLIADESFSLLRFILMTCIYAWPVVIAINIILPSTARLRAVSGSIYLVILLGVFAVAALLSTDVSVPDLFLSWAIFALPPTILLLLFLNRRIRAVGPMVLTFTVLSVTGANVALAFVASSDTALGAVAGLAVFVGSNAIGAFIAIILVGLAIFAVIGWLANRWIRNLYLGKRLNDQSLALHSMWLLFAAVQSIGLAFVSPGWYAAGIAAFLAYLVTVHVGLGFAAPANPPSPATLLFLRVFSLGRGSEQIFEALSTHWRYLGDVRMIAGPDLAIATVEPHEFLAYLSGKLRGAFVRDRTSFDDSLSGLDTRPDFDCRYRVNDFFCYDHTWRMVLCELAQACDVVFMDVRGFSPSNAGVIFELDELVNEVPLQRFVLAFDSTTDMVFLSETLESSWSNLRSDSPNRHARNAAVTLCEINPGRPQHIHHVLHSLCAATTT